MLVLTRRRDEAILIDGGRIKIKILAVVHGAVRVGIEADGLTIDRDEIHRRKLQQKEATRD
jgi:carbon storage regulator CsrA